MIVDDEEAIHQAIKVLGNWEKYQVTKILDAYNGQEALELLQQSWVDLIFLDIKMPQLGGLELIEHLQGLSFYPRIIIISGYDDFEYMQFAIRMKIEDYLLKPLNRYEFEETLDRTIAKLEKDKLTKLKMEQNETGSESLLTEHSLKQLIYAMGDLSVKQEKFSKYVFQRQKYCCVSQIYIANFDKINQSVFNGDSYLAYKSLCNIIYKQSKTIGESCSFRDDMQWNTIVTIIVYENNQPLEGLKQNFLKINKSLKEKFQAEVTVCISSACSNETSLQECYNKVKDFLFRVNILKNDQKVYIIETECINDTFHFIPVNRAILLSAFQTQNLNLAEKTIEDYYVKIMQNKFYSHKIAGKIIFEWITALEYIQTYLNVSFNDLQYNTIMDDLIKAGYLIDSAKDILKKLINKQIKQYSNMQKSNERIPEIIKTYIDRNYSTKIGLNTFSDYFFLHKDYLSRLFKAEYGFSIAEYLMRVRMKKARELLENSDLSVKLIAEQVGFPDNNYFSKAFKNYWGFSPTEIKYSKNTLETSKKI